MYDLTTLQAAYWVGRQSHDLQAGDSAHLYVEFDGVGIDLERLSDAVERIFEHHPVLRMTVSETGTWSVSEQSQWHQLRIRDWRDLTRKQCDQQLTELRQSKTHQRLAIDDGQAAEFSLTLLPDHGFRFHIDVDMIAADAPGFRTLVHDLVALYHDQGMRLARPSFTVFLAGVQDNETLTALQQRDRKYWQSKLENIAPAPVLPGQNNNACRGTGSAHHTERHAVQLTAQQRSQLQALANRYRISITTLSLTAFNCVLAHAIYQATFRINLPMFYRPEQYQHTVGDFAQLSLFSAQVDSDCSLLEMCEQTQQQLTQCIEHRHYSGVNIMRDLSRQRGSLQTSPVVFTSGWDIDGDLFATEVHDTLGELVWSSSQGAHVLLDAQIVPYRNGVLINWDVRVDQVAPAFYQTLFQRYVALLQHMATDPGCMLKQYQYLASEQSSVVSLGIPEHTMPLSDLQKAYLVGRQTQLPLGGVAMQDFRCYHGHVDIVQLRTRLAEMVDKLAVLRTHIDEHQLVQWVSEERTLNFEHFDWSHLSRDEAIVKADDLVARCSHYRHDLSASPWKVWVVSLPEAEGDDSAFRQIVLTSMDALISDGHSIAYLLARLLESAPKPLLVPANHSDQAGEITLATAERVSAGPEREQAERYWRDKLAAVDTPVALPWLQPLQQIFEPHYARQTICLPAQQTQALFKLAAEQRLFANSLLTGLILETLSAWTPHGQLCIGLPVAPPPQAGRLDNHSSFIALTYSNARSDFADRVAQIQRDIAHGVAHLSFSGIDLNRLLLSHFESGHIPLPVVITNGLGWETLCDGDSVRQHTGLTQTPQIAIDFRITYDEERNLCISADYVTQALSKEQVKTWLNVINRAMLDMIELQAIQWRANQLVPLGHYCHNSSAVVNSDPYLTIISQRLFSSADDNTALISDGQSWSYTALGLHVRRIMTHLQGFGLQPGDVVAVCLPRGAEHIMVSVACALSGLIWVPVDEASPAERKAYLLSHCQASLVVTRGSDDSHGGVSIAALTGPVDSLVEVADDESLSRLSASEKAGYYLYTSGTTGQPKCVVVNHRATANVLHHTRKQWQVTEQDVFISVTPLHHDMSVFDVFGSLSAGATLVIPDADSDKDALYWNELVSSYGVTVWCSVPAILEMLLACQSPGQGHTLRLIAQGGDYIKPQTIQTLRDTLPEARLFSLGGPTETTIWSIWHEISAADRQIIPYGRPLPGNQYYIVDQAHRHCPTGVEGRIVTAGVNLALGYLVEGEIDQTDFIQLESPSGQVVRAFKTGDQGYYRDDGTIIFSGRVNGYVKVRGVRVSLPDIEQQLSATGRVRDLAVIDYLDPRSNDIGLALFYVCQDTKQISASEWRTLIRQRLPASHLPQQFIALQQFPLSANGKKDRRALKARLEAPEYPEPAHLAVCSDHSTQAPARTGREDHASSSSHCRQVIDIYQRVLGLDAALLSEHSEFIAAGLLPSHIKTVAEELTSHFGLPVNARNLLSCKNAAQVVTLLQQAE